MQLIVPTVGQEPGPTYALDINSSLTLIDQHDHSPGKGVQITPAGIDINSALTFNNNPLLNASYVSLQAGASASTVPQSISSAPISNINELFYTDSNGTITQITANGVVNATAAAIPGESYDAGTFIWVQTQSSLPTRPANFDIGSITLRPNIDGTTNGVILGPPSAISSQYNIQLPLVPATTSIMQLDNAGNMIATLVPDNSTITISSQILKIPNQGVTATQIANQTITNTQLADPNIGAPLSTGNDHVASFSTSSSTPVTVTSIHSPNPLQVEITVPATETGNRPIVVGLQALIPVGGFISNGAITVVNSSSSSVAGTVSIVDVTNGVTISTQTIGSNSSGSSATSLSVPLSGFSCVYFAPGTGSNIEFNVKLAVTTGNSITITNAQLYCYEL
jgi:hypothetical protein